MSCEGVSFRGKASICLMGCAGAAQGSGALLHGQRSEGVQRSRIPANNFKVPHTTTSWQPFAGLTNTTAHSHLSVTCKQSRKLALVWQELLVLLRGRPAVRARALRGGLLALLHTRVHRVPAPAAPGVDGRRYALPGQRGR